MQLRSKLMGARLASLLVLAGCGGGGGTPTGATVSDGSSGSSAGTTVSGGGGGATAPTVVLSGSAAKGILIGAEVNVYSLAGGKKADKPLGTTTTNSMGQYTLNIPPTTDPVMIEIKAISSTKMLDETGALVDGKFPEVAAPTGLTIRSFAANASQQTVVRVNPLTEMAVAVAANATGGLSINNLITGQQVAQSAAPAGVNPFTQEPVAEPASMDADQLKFAIKMAGLMSAAKADTACDVPCQIGKLSNGVSFTIAADGVANFPPAVTQQIAQRSSALFASGTTSLKVNANQTNILASTGAQLKATADSRVTTPVALVTAKPEEVLASNGLQGFVNAMRNGFRTTEERLLKAEQDFNKRYENVTFEGIESVNRLLSSIERDCDTDLLVCKTTPSSPIQWTGSNGSYNWVRTIPDDVGRTTSGTLVGVTGSDGKRSVTVNGTFSIKGKQTAEIKNLSISLTGQNDNFTGVINGVVLVNHQSSDLTVSLNLENIQVGSTVVKPKEVSNISFKGGLSLVASNGDKLSGTLDIKMVEVRRQVFYGRNNEFSYTDFDEYVTDGDIQIKALTTASGAPLEIVALDFNWISRQPSYTLPVNANNVESYDGSVKIALADKLTSLTFNESATNWQDVKQAVSIASGLSEVRLSATFSLANQSGSWCRWNHNVKRCANQLNLESANANPYKATLTKDSNGKTKGDILLGNTKVGEFVNGVMKINGAEVSLY
jgi:hypothetical protein